MDKFMRSFLKRTYLLLIDLDQQQYAWILREMDFPTVPDSVPLAAMLKTLQEYARVAFHPAEYDKLLQQVGRILTTRN